MIATRLHAQRHSTLNLNRRSLTSIHSVSANQISQQQVKTNDQLTTDIRNIDSDNNDDDDETTKVEHISYSF